LAADALLASPLATSTFLKLCPYNKRYFELDDPLTVSIWVKNVPHMHFKVFEINTDTYYRRNDFKPFESDVNLDGLGA
jgi:hypothetical protein